MKKTGKLTHLLFIFFALILFPANIMASEPDSVTLKLPDVIVRNVKCKAEISIYKNGELLTKSDSLKVSINGADSVLYFLSGTAAYETRFDSKRDEVVCLQETRASASCKANPIPLWFSIIPPLIAILFALIFKEVFSALILGLFSGTFIIALHQGAGILKSILLGFFRLIDTYIIQALNDPDHLSIIIFSLLIGGMVGIITRNGGMHGVVRLISKKAKDSRSGQLVTWFLGIAVFFDDYANTLVVGNTMRNITDKLKISRVKLAYIVDSTAAPMAAIAFITTWIGAELSYIQNGIENLGIDANPYGIFFASLQYSFYPVLTLVFVFILVMSRRDFGSMYRFELKARQGKSGSEAGLQEKQPEKVEISSAWNALLPVLLIVFGTIAGLIFTGWDKTIWADDSIGFGNKLSHTIGQGDSFKALLWSSFGGVILAISMSIGKKLLNLRQSIESMINGFKSMLTAILILTFAWALALLTKHLHTADFISHIMQTLSVSPPWIPAISFVFSAFIAFSTGSSWGTMAIMYPLILPATWLICTEYGYDQPQAMMIFHNVVSTVIAGSVLGDHCSPISDTTILSSLSSGCQHIDHVKTQMPYAMTVGAVALIFGVIPAAFGIPFYILLPLDIAILYLVIRIFGKKLPVTKLSEDSGVNK